jgi:hypothetical protein
MDKVEKANSISLNRLEGVSIVGNLTAALAKFDAGYPSDHSAAMRDTVLGRMITTKRGDRVQGHVFFPVSAALQIADEGAPQHVLCSYMFSHECAHVQDLEKRAQSLTNDDLLTPPLAQPVALTHQIAWNEYAACRLSAFSDPDRSDDYKEMLRHSVEKYVASRHKPHEAFEPSQAGRIAALDLALEITLPVLQAFAYLLGHCRGIDAPLSSLLPENYLVLASEHSIGDAFAKVESQLDAMWESRVSWQGYNAFTDLVIANCTLIKVLTGVVMIPGRNRQMGVALAK